VAVRRAEAFSAQALRPARRRGIDRRAYLSIIRGERRGPFAALARGGLRAASLCFRAGVACRSALFGAGLLAEERARVPVISVGNLTAGGTGKTPLVIALAQRLVDAGERVAVLARGYGAREGELNDELELVHARVPGARVHAGADRVSSAARAEADGATVILLDDGFQHRRLARDVNILVIDATDPWGTGFLLPRGLLREPIAAAARATDIVISRVEQVAKERVEAIRLTLDRAGVRAPCATMTLAVSGIRRLGGGAPLEAAGKRVLLLSGIGNPQAFERTATQAGVRVEGAIALPDHHAFTLGDLSRAADEAKRLGVDAVLVTEKDAVKLEPLAAGLATPLYALAVDARLERADELLARIDAALAASRKRSKEIGPESALRAQHAGGAI
jgi:tetraacyldisaccharide 4'-kinase